MAALRTLPVTRVADATAAGDLVAGLVLDAYEAASPAPFQLGCPSGRTPMTTYAAIGRRAAARHLSLDRLVVVMMDEYLVDGALAPPTEHFSCRRFVGAHVLPHVGARPVLCPSPEDPAAHDRIPIDVFLLASGASDGHVAFNPPGTALDTPTRVVDLAESTRRDNMVTFPQFASLDEVPRQGVSSGLATITAAARAILLLLGPDKATSWRRLQAGGGFDPAWPVSVVYECADPLVVVDEAAADGP
jgi:glucosamine-6-phosphate deaminase